MSDHPNKSSSSAGYPVPGDPTKIMEGREDDNGDDDNYREKNSRHSSDEEGDSGDDKDCVGDRRGCESETEDASTDLEVEEVRRYLAAKLGLSDLSLGGDDQRQPSVLLSLDLDGIVEYIQAGKAKKIITMAGAGISTSAGIPDFRSPGTGLYDNLQKYNLPNPTAVFDIRYFEENPKPFFLLAKELYPGKFLPTVSHSFVRLLQERGLLLRHYTQNIDTLERVAGLREESLVEAHGAFHTGHCIRCRKEFSQDWIKERIFRDEVPTCTVSSCAGYVKPDIVFFGENLPQRFFQCVEKDFRECDLLIILGTSLVVQPFASLVDRVGPSCPRLLINMEKVGVASRLDQLLGGGGLRLDCPGNYRDVALLGECDQGCRDLARALGWEKQLEDLTMKK